MNIKTALPLAIAALLVALPVSHAQAQTWELTKVTDGAAKPSLAVDSQGAPHVVYMLEANLGFVGYASWNAAAQSFDAGQVVTGYFYGPPAIALDGQDRPHISYHDHTTQDQAHLHLSAQGWINSQIPAPGHDGWDNSILVDANGIVHTSSIDPRGAGINYTRSIPSGWIVEAVGSQPINYRYSTSIALDAAGIPHIAYFNDLTADLMLASRTAGWVVSAIDTEGDVGQFASLEIDDDDSKHIAYLAVLDNGSGLVKYARFDGQGWSFETIDKLDNIFTVAARNMISLELDQDGNPHVTYGDEKVVRYAFRQSDQWVREVIVDERLSDKLLGQQTSLALDARGVANVVYYVVTNSSPLMGDIMYGKRDQAATVAVDPSRLPEETVRFEIYPNPVRSEAHVEYSIAVAANPLSQTSLTLYDVRGRVVYSDSRLPASSGRYRISVGSNRLASGIYIVSLTVGARSFRKLLVVVE